MKIIKVKYMLVHVHINIILNPLTTYRMKCLTDVPNWKIIKTNVLKHVNNNIECYFQCNIS